MEGSDLQAWRGKNPGVRAARPRAILAVLSADGLAQAVGCGCNKLCDHEADAHSPRLCFRSPLRCRRFQARIIVKWRATADKRGNPLSPWHYDASIGSLAIANFPHHSMRLVPIVGGARIDMQRDRKQYGREGGVLHHM